MRCDVARMTPHPKTQLAHKEEIKTCGGKRESERTGITHIYAHYIRKCLFTTILCVQIFPLYSHYTEIILKWNKWWRKTQLIIRTN